MRDWYYKWFYVQQEQELFMACDVSQILEQQESWSMRQTSAMMVQVQELLKLFDRTRIDGPIVTTNFIFRRVQPCKERVHPMYEYSRSNDVTQESLDGHPSEEIDRWLAQLLDLAGHRLLPNAMRAYKLTSPPPQVCAKSFAILTPYLIITGLQP
jgi:hypothetical protein